MHIKFAEDGQPEVFMRQVRGVAVAFAMFAVSGTACHAQTLDQSAWNYAWDRLEEVVAGSKHGKLAADEIVNVLKFPRPLAGGTAGKVDFKGALQLQNIAGIIPKRDFALDPSDQDIRLHNVYRNVLRSLQAPDVTPDQQKKIDEASAAYDKALTAFEVERDKWADKIDKEMERLKKLGSNPDESDYLRIRDATSGPVASKAQALETALARWENALPSTWALVDALRQFKQATVGTQDTLSSGIWNYVYVDPINWEGEVCDPTNSTGWYEMSMTKDVKAQSIRTSSWNANGGWAGTFVKIGAGGGGGNYENLITTDKESVKVRFCNIRYVAVSAPWLSMDVLRDVDRGVYKQKSDSLITGKVLGPTGLVPRLVKGLVIARDVQIAVNLDKTKVEEIRKSYGGSGGFSIGPFRIGGSDAKTQYTTLDSKDAGYFGLSTNYKRPVVLGIVIQETVSPSMP